MTTEILEPQTIDYFIFITRFCEPAKRVDTKCEVKKLILAVPDTVGDPDTPLEEIELAAIFTDGGSEGVKHVDKRRVSAWVDRLPE